MSLSSLHSAGPTQYTWQEFQQLPRTGSDFLLNTRAIQVRLDARSDNPHRIRTVVFRAPQGCSRRVFDQLKKAAGERMLTWEAKDGWELSSPLRLTGPFPYSDRNTGALVLGEEEYRWQGIFRYTRSPKKVRIELDPATVKQDPEHKLTVQEAMKAWKITAPQTEP